MKSTIVFALAAAAAIASGAARADRDDPAQHVIDFQGSRTRAEVQAEAVRYATTHSNVPAAAVVQPALQSSLDARELQTQAAQAARQGLIPRGEAS